MVTASLVATLVSDITDRAFAFLFPDPSAAIGETVRRLLPSAFVAGSVFLVLLAALVAVFASRDAMRRARQSGTSPRATIRLAVLLAAAGIGLIDARLSATSTHPIAAPDR